MNRDTLSQRFSNIFYVLRENGYVYIKETKVQNRSCHAQKINILVKLVKSIYKLRDTNG